MLGNSLSDVPNIYFQDVTAIEFDSLKTYFDEKQDNTLARIIGKAKLHKSSKAYF